MQTQSDKEAEKQKGMPAPDQPQDLKEGMELSVRGFRIYKVMRVRPDGKVVLKPKG